MSSQRPVGSITRGTTNPNRLRRCDRWLLATHRDTLTKGGPPFVVDLGHGASGVTTTEWAARIHPVRPDARVVGLEIDPERVETAQAWRRPGVEFALGGFEVPLPGQRRASVIRAFNVLRQYDEAEVAVAWARMRERLEPGGLLVDGTCDEVGRLATWVALEQAGPVSLTISVGLRTLVRPLDVAPRLPKALIHRNVPGQRVHAWLTALDEAWIRAAALAAYGRRQRFIAACGAVRDAGWPVLGGPSRWRLGEVEVRWEAVAPTPEDHTSGPQA